MKQLKIKILGTDYDLKQTFSGLILFEEMTGRNSTEITENISDVMKMFYCFLKGGNKTTFTYTYPEFLEVVDDHPEIFEDFTKYLIGLGKPTRKK